MQGNISGVIIILKVRNDPFVKYQYFLRKLFVLIFYATLKFLRHLEVSFYIILNRNNLRGRSLQSFQLKFKKKIFFMKKWY